MIDQFRKLLKVMDPAELTAHDRIDLINFLGLAMPGSAIRSDPIRSDPIHYTKIRPNPLLGA